ncbi:hypothetical protein [Pedobacter rhizosphaerae]|uniref:IPTL-CTERM protein sorting domain-containing protein n=1 Tax=Pedobacter rhizosphaerae TaxID=390241 RepID=A0A1H9N7W3_9SPHI|nr:hypothetical protein [Pedobacter rhizosphaerae]SER31988.1 hypothetical protein SAMN04488023_10792 [Pedobacter rhizosphaerae]
MKYCFSYLLLLFLFTSYNSFAQSGCYVGATATGYRLYFVKHPTLGGNNYTSQPANNNYIVLGTGSYNCTNFPNSTFATSIGAAGVACSVYSESPQVFIGNGTVRTYRVYMCPLDGSITWLSLLIIASVGIIIIQKCRPVVEK